MAWVTLQARLDEMFRGLTRVALDHAAPQPGERVIDVGCGCGATLLGLARQVGKDGKVLGVDVSQPMLSRAQERIAEAGYSQAEVALADAATYTFEPNSCDLVFSRFGVMFFRDPVEAFTNLRRALTPKGRLVFAAFRPLQENPWVLVPLTAAKPLLPPITPPGPEDPGQFAFADPERVRRILGAAGFRDVTFTPHDPDMVLAGPGGATDAAAFSAQLGPVSRALAEAAESLKQTVRNALADEFRRHDGPNGISLPAAIWIVSARA